MSPKYRGKSDDWLDSAEGGRGKSVRKKKGGPKASDLLDPSEANATVVEVFPKLCRIKFDIDSSVAKGERLCSYRRASVMAPNPKLEELGIKERSPVAVGDRVKVSTTDPQSGVVEGVCQRSSFLARPAPDRDEGLIHVLAANIECLVIVASTRHPDFSSGLVDRFLIAAESSGITPWVVISKVDLSLEDAERAATLYQSIGIRVFEVSSKTGEGIGALREQLLKKRVAFCGHSGVGKTSLLNALLSEVEGRVAGRVAETSDSTGKGRHTTTSAVLIEGPLTSSWIDTPGVREFGLWNIKPEMLKEFFPEFRELSCNQNQCFHQDEEGCAAKALQRYPSYLRVLESLISGKH